MTKRQNKLGEKSLIARLSSEVTNYFKSCQRELVNQVKTGAPSVSSGGGRQWLPNQVLARPHPLPHWAGEPDYWVTNPAPDVEGELTIALLISVAVRRDKGSRLNVSCKTNQVMTPSKKEGCAHFYSFFDILGPFPFVQAIGTWGCTHIFYDPLFRSY